jgi:hypothetical protein
MLPVMIKKSGLMETKLPMRPSILARPELKVKQQIKKVLQTYKPM